MSLAREFRAFIARGNVVDLAVAVVIGAAFGRIVTQIVDGIIMPVLGAVVPGGDWKTWEVTSLHIKLGAVLGASVDFVIVAFVIFLVVNKLMHRVLKKEEAPAAGPTTKECNECLETIPYAARKCRACGSALVALALVVLAAAAGRAQAQAPKPGDPKFEYGKQEEVKAVEWKAQAKAGLLVSTGNSQQRSLSATASASRKETANKFAFDAGIAYARSNILVATDLNANMTIDSDGEIERVSATTAKSWYGKVRYDRFFTARNSVFVTGQIAADTPAGKALYGGGQVGYSRLLFKDDLHEAVAELGYDFTYEDYVAPGDPVAIHSARVFAGEALKIGELTAAFVNVEVLGNLNEEDTPTGTFGAFEDTRVIGKAGLTAMIWENVSLGFTFTLKYDTAPAPLPPFPALAFAPGFQPEAEKLDTLTEATLIVNFI